jgi:chromosome segregation protein
MKLHALRLHGFKSFADRTEIVFHDGITAVVGPNGCGKSNISDAIRWVLGEQRPTAIRGARMEEAIFQGTVTRRPVNRGSVSIEVTNEDSALPVPYQEVEIARTVYRDGGSDYSLNRTACRLKDVQELCRDTGLGANAYAVIENRMIDAILSDRAEERRGLFEEAAGIGKYKDRRRAAARRLERAELDLQRLEDLIAEIGTKVRSLARQKGKAERFRELRRRRLDVELTVARSRLDGIEEELGTLRADLAGGQEREEGLRAAVTAAEGRLEVLRGEQLEAERARTSIGARVREFNDRLSRLEREIAVREERLRHAARRLERIGEERDESRERVAELEREEAGLRERAGELDRALEELASRVGEDEVHWKDVKERLSAARDVATRIEARERDVALRSAQLQGDAAGGEGRTVDLDERIVHLEAAIQEIHEAIAEVAAQGDLFTDRVSTLEEEVSLARERHEQLVEAVARARSRLHEARTTEMAAQDRHGEISARVAALSRMEQDGEGMDPVVRAVLALDFDGVEGILADSIRSAPALSTAVEAVLGAHLRALIVRDRKVATRLVGWFHDEWKKGGGLILLPLDQVPVNGGEGPLLDELTLTGAGAPWVRALLHGISLGEAVGPAGRTAGGSMVGSTGSWVEHGGALRVGNPFGPSGILERRDRLRELQSEAAGAEELAKGMHQERVLAEDGLNALESTLEEAREAVRNAEDAGREARAREDARSERSRRLQGEAEELENQLNLTRTARQRSEEAVRKLLGEREELLAEEETLREERARAREALGAVQEEWDAARAAETAVTIERTKLEGERERVAERTQSLASQREQVSSRLRALDEEQEALEEERKLLGDQLAEGRAEMEELFQLGDEAGEEFRTCESRLDNLRETVAEAERAVRDARARERERSERRHALELGRHELESRAGRIRDRLEGEWGRPFDELLAEASMVEGTPEELDLELKEIVETLGRLGPVNMLAVEEHEEESQRLTFLTGQRDDLVDARDDLRNAIREINQTATRLFMETFDAIRTNFRETFQRLFQGGECDLWLTDPDDPLESDVEIHAAPRGKRTQRIDLLSGGERALTALSLLFGIYLVKPSPFCVLDEVDAPLDESNIGRFIRLLQEFKERTQFVVITHNPRTIEAADWIYGVTMEEPGVSKIVGVRLDEALEVAGV